MKTDAPICLVAASYSTRHLAVRDLDAVWATRGAGDFHHTSIALLAKDSDGTLRVERDRSTAKHLAWGGALLGGALFVLAPATGIAMLAVVGLSGAGAIVGHLRHNSAPDRLAEAGDVLAQGTWGLVVVVLNRRGEAVTSLLEHADRSCSVDMLWGQLEEELCFDLSRLDSDTVLIPT